MTDQPWLLYSPVEPARDAPRRGRQGIHSFTWSLWPWMNWLLPVVGILCVGNGGWALLLLLVVSPVLVPAAGLLGSLPRFVLRRSGAVTTPAPITALLLLQWWAWGAAMITPPGATDGSPIPAVMQVLSPLPISGGFLSAVLLGASLIAVSCWIAVLVIAIVLASRAEPARRQGAKGWTAAAWIAAFALPLLLVATIWLGGAVTAQQRDAAGATVAEVQALPLSEQAARAVERHDRAQAQLSAVRGMIAEDGWELSSRGIDTRTSFSEAVESYGFDLRFEHRASPGESVDADAVAAELLRQGWTEGERGAIVDPHGNVVEISANDDRVWVSLNSPTWWGDAYDLFEELGGYDPADGAFEQTYAYDEWPEL